jgi:tetratricopeptide (TPR) repeat protein
VNTPLRRSRLVGIALLLAFPLVQPPLSEALVTRGDALQFSGSRRALEKYRLALTLDAANADAADRYAFASFLGRDRSQMRDALRITDRFLGTRPDDGALRLDRALLRQALRDYRGAADDFAALGRSGNPLARRLAAADARRIGGLR